MQKGREGAYHPHHDAHGVRVTFEAFVELDHLLVYHHFSHHSLLEFNQLALGGQDAVEQKIAGLHVGGVLGELLDRVASVEQLAFLAVDVADVGDAAGCAHETWVVGQQVGLAQKGAHVDEIGA